MYSVVKKGLTSNLALKVLSLIAGYTFWLLLSQNREITLWVTVPLSFYNTASSISIDAPASIAVELSGKRAALESLDFDSLSVHINAQKFNKGSHIIPILEHNLFLPDKITMVHSKPSIVAIKVV